MSDYTPPEIKFAPREIFEQILEYAVIPTFDLLLEMPDGGVVLARRTIAPYKDVWALPGLRMFKPEEIDDTLKRIARNEVGVEIEPANRIYLGQFVGKFTEEFNRQDLSTGYHIRVAPGQIIRPNAAHFSEVLYVKSMDEVPADTGEMYVFYLNEFFRRRNHGEL